MNKKVFIAGAFRKKKYQIFLESIEKILKAKGYRTVIGARDIDNYCKIPIERNLFWKKIIKEIKSSDMLLVDMKNVGTGFGRVIEAGIAKALGIKVILLYPARFKTDECLEEIADKIISYKTLKSLENKLRELKN